MLKEILDSNVFELQPSGIEAHKLLNIGEIIHSPLRRIFNKVKIEYPTIHQKSALWLSIKSMIDKMGGEGFVPS